VPSNKASVCHHTGISFNAASRAPLKSSRRRTSLYRKWLSTWDVPIRAISPDCSSASPEKLLGRFDIAIAERYQEHRVIDVARSCQYQKGRSQRRGPDDTCRQGHPARSWRTTLPVSNMASSGLHTGSPRCPWPSDFDGCGKKEIPRVTLLIGDGKKLAHRGHMFRPAGI
jgi:hypothetical protein